MNASALEFFKIVSASLGVSGALFFFLFVGWVPSPITERLDAHDASTAETVRIQKVQCAILAKLANASDAQCYFPPRSPMTSLLPARNESLHP
jgi:hypothetical protein